jgi:hypothetical protein
MILQAIEAGYATALHDLRTGGLDDAVRAWRPDLSADVRHPTRPPTDPTATARDHPRP